jgi:hypothetical protein
MEHLVGKVDLTFNAYQSFQQRTSDRNQNSKLRLHMLTHSKLSMLFAAASVAPKLLEAVEKDWSLERCTHVKSFFLLMQLDATFSSRQVSE